LEAETKEKLMKVYNVFTVITLLAGFAWAFYSFTVGVLLYSNLGAKFKVWYIFGTMMYWRVAASVFRPFTFPNRIILLEIILIIATLYMFLFIKGL
jgi:hypothetical protein